MSIKQNKKVVRQVKFGCGRAVARHASKHLGVASANLNRKLPQKHTQAKQLHKFGSDTF